MIKSLFIAFAIILSFSCLGHDLVVQMKKNLIKSKVNSIIKSREKNGEIPIKINTKSVDLKPVSLKELPEAVQIYANGLFGLDLTNPLDLKIKFFTPSAGISSTVKDLSFHVLSKTKLKAKIAIDISKLHVTIPTIKVSETNIVRHATYKEGRCSSKKERLEKELWAKASLKISPRNDDIDPIKLAASVIIEKKGDVLKFRLSTLTSNLDEILNSFYRISLRNLTLPEMFVVKDGDCYPLGTEELEKFLTGKIKAKIPGIIRKLNKTLVKKGLENANKKLVNIEFPTSKEINLYHSEVIGSSYSESSELYDLGEPYYHQVLQDNTRVVKNYYHEDYSFKPLVKETGVLANNKFLKKLFDQVPNMNYNLELNEFHSISRKYFGLTLNETLEIGGNSLDLREYRKELAKNTVAKKNADISISVNETVINEKFDLLNNLGVLEDKLPAGFSFYKDKIRAKVLSGKVYIYSSLKVNLNKTEKIALKIVKYWEKVFGSHKGIVYIPVIIKLVPRFNKEKQTISLHTRLLQSDSEIKKLKLKSTKEDLSYLVEKILPRVMNHVNKKFIVRNEVVSVAKLYQTTGVKVKDILLLDDSFITFLFDIKNLDILLEKVGLDSFFNKVIPND